MNGREKEMEQDNSKYYISSIKRLVWCPLSKNTITDNHKIKIITELLDNLRPVSPKPGHVERVRTPSCSQSSADFDDDSSAVFRERFLKINVRHITDGQVKCVNSSPMFTNLQTPRSDRCWQYTSQTAI